MDDEPKWQRVNDDTERLPIYGHTETMGRRYTRGWLYRVIPVRQITPASVVWVPAE